MKQISGWQILLTFIGLLVIISPSIANAEKITFGGVINIAPMSYHENKKVIGFMPEVFEAILKKANVEASIVLLPFKRLNAYLKHGKIEGTLSIFHQKSREDYLLYSDSPILISRSLVFVKKGNEFPFNTISDLQGKKIGAMAGWSARNQEYEKAKMDGSLLIAGVSSYEQNLKKLISGRIDCVILTELTTWYHARRLGNDDLIVSLEKPIDKSLTYFAISRKSPKFAQMRMVMKKLNEAHQNIIEDGTYSAIQQKYGIKASVK